MKDNKPANPWPVWNVPHETRKTLKKIAAELDIPLGQVLTMAANLLWDDVKVRGEK